MRRFLNIFSRTLIALFLVTGCLFVSVQNSHADTIDDMAWVLDKMGDASPFKSQGIDGNSLRDSKGMINCLAGGKNVVACMADYSETPIGKKISSESGVPSWVPMLMHTYVAFIEKDYWGVVYYLGEAALCIAAQVLAEGLDVCGILKEIVELASMAVNAVWDFLSGLGSAVGEALGGLGCALSICCCDSSGPVFPFIYQYYFQPTLQNGLKAKEAIDANAYTKYLNDLKANANNRGPTYFPDPLKIMTMIGYNANDVQLAADSYDQVVKTLWDADMLQRVLPELGKKRAEYYNNPLIFSMLAAGSLQQQNPAGWITSSCNEQFDKTYGLEHVDRWLSSFTKDADLAKLKQKTKRNYSWCADEYVGGHKKVLRQKYREHINKQYCPSVGEKQICSTDDKLNTCRRILGSLSWEDNGRCVKTPPCALTQYGGLNCSSLDSYKACTSTMGTDANKCGINITATGMDIAQKIDAYFKSQGSQFPCVYAALDFSKGGNNTSIPVEFVCTRPAQQYACKEKYSELVGTQPITFVNCSLNEDAAYSALRKKVEYIYYNLKKGNNLVKAGAPKAIHSPALMSGAKTVYPGNTTSKPVSAKDATAIKPGSVGINCGNWINQSARDPLQLVAETCLVKIIMENPDQNMGFGPPSRKPGFDYGTIPVNKIDGASTPVLMIGTAPGNSKIDHNKVNKTFVPDKTTLPKPGPSPDPYNKLSTPSDKMTVPGASKNINAPAASKSGIIMNQSAPVSGKTPATAPATNMMNQGYK